MLLPNAEMSPRTFAKTLLRSACHDGVGLGVPHLRLRQSAAPAVAAASDTPAATAGASNDREPVDEPR